MKKMVMMFVAVMMAAGLAQPALANPGWSGGQRWDDRDRYERSSGRHDDCGYRLGRDRRWVHRAPVVVHRVPEPVVYLPRPHVPAIGLFFPHMVIHIR